MKKINVEHVNDLARLKEEDLEKYEVKLNDIMTEIDKILDVEINTKEIMISPIENINRYYDESEIELIDKKEVLEMANKTNGDFIVVSRVIND
ncbi:MAG: aspartyl/glutamyl-tRNA amidotransferase subunit C [Firmicutes bacterium]|nr:aspartyl/glutamyl-tRNA amidotransferase subunit C [Bacillota bacterium]